MDGIYILLILLGVLFLPDIVRRLFSAKSQLIKELKKSPSKPIHSVKDKEYVRLHGKAEVAGETLIAPISGKECVYYHVKVTVEKNYAYSNFLTLFSSPKVLIDELKCSDFYLNAQGERALINIDHRKSLLVHLEREDSRSTTNRSRRIEELLRRHRKDSYRLSSRLQCEEAILVPNENVVVKGIAKWEKLEIEEGDTSSRRLTISGDSNNNLIVTDLPEAIKILPKQK